jgi:hypothetical protein
MSDPRKSFRSKWLVQAVAGMEGALGVPTESWIPAVHPSNAEWQYIQALYAPLGLSALEVSTIEGSPFVRIFPQGTPKTLGRAPEYKIEGVGLNYAPGVIQRSWDIRLTSQVQGLYEGLRYISEVSNYGNPTRHRPVLVLDFSWPETRDIIAARAAGYPPYTVRLGMIRNLQSGGPAGGYPGYEQFSGVGGQGISFEFVEATLRRAS